MTVAAGVVTYTTSYDLYGTPFDQWPNPQAASTFSLTASKRMPRLYGFTTP